MEESVRMENGLEREADEGNRLAPWSVRSFDPYDQWIDEMLLDLHGSMEEELNESVR